MLFHGLYQQAEVPVNFCLVPFSLASSKLTMPRYHLSPRQRQANAYFSSLSEADRKRKAKVFHDHLIRNEGLIEIARDDILSSFELYCDSVLRDRPGPTCMRFRSYIFLLRKLRALEERHLQWGTTVYKILPWPRELSQRELLQRYMSARQTHSLTSTAGATSSTPTASLTRTIMGLLNEHR